MKEVKIYGLSLWPPWGSLIAWLEKQFETRSWATSYRGVIAVHQTGSFPDEAKNLCRNNQVFVDVLGKHGVDVTAPDGDQLDRLPRGAIIALAEITECVPTEQIRGNLTEQELAFGGWGDGRFAWRLHDAMALETPIFCRGSQKLWGLPADVRAALVAQLNATRLERSHQPAGG